MQSSESMARIRHFAIEHFYNSLVTLCKNSRDSNTFRLYSAVALILYDRVGHGVSELNELKSEAGMQLPVAICLSYANKSESFELQLKELKKTAGCTELYHAAMVLFIFEKYKKALDYVNKALNMDANHEESLCLKGWLCLLLTSHNKPSDLFEKVLQSNAQNLDASLGLAESYLQESNADGALGVLNKTIVRFPANSLPLIQKMRTLFSIQDWEQTIETMNRVIVTDTNNLEAVQTNILILICRDGNYDEAAQCIRKFCEILELVEPKNGRLYIENAALFSKCCGRNINVLTETYKMVETAVQFSPKNAEYFNELGYQCLLQDKTKEAAKLFKQATKISDASVNALIGLTHCEYIQNGKSEQTKQQAEFLTELEEDPSPMLLFIKAKLADNGDESLAFLNQAVEKQMKTINGRPYGAKYLLNLNVDFLLDIVKEYLLHTSSSRGLIDMQLQRKDSNYSVVPLNIVKIITKACPGLQEATYLLAKLQFLNGETQNAMLVLEKALNNPIAAYHEAYLLLAQIQLHNGLFDRAAQSLELCLSQNFHVRENPLYYYLLGTIKKHSGSLNEAIECFNAAQDLIRNKMQNTTISDKAAIYTELVTSYMAANQTEDANRLLQEAMDELQGTAQESSVMMLSADIAICNKNVRKAVDILSAVTPNDPCYLQAKRKLAGIFLDDSVDKKAFIKCYEDLVQTNPVSESYVLLGDAYMEILGKA